MCVKNNVVEGWWVCLYLFGVCLEEYTHSYKVVEEW
jgi:hypothetical protein